MLRLGGLFRAGTLVLALGGPTPGALVCASLAFVSGV